MLARKPCAGTQARWHVVMLGAWFSKPKISYMFRKKFLLTFRDDCWHVFHSIAQKMKQKNPTLKRIFFFTKKNTPYILGWFMYQVEKLKNPLYFDMTSDLVYLSNIWNPSEINKFILISGNFLTLSCDHHLAHLTSSTLM